MAELLARVRALLRRTHVTGSEGPLVTFGEVTVDLARRQVTRSGAEVHLTPIEYRLLAVLIARAGRVITHRLLREVWGPSHTEDTHYPRVYMTGLRRKLEENPPPPRHIRTESGLPSRRDNVRRHDGLKRAFLFDPTCQAY
ncbi:winged helix-turn-helix domain-containing protein [Thiobacillus denitrificans]|uniref:winged helix-turn-helix domain-containing protein n=1 Tax=Thiobacillus denitrificans TaxID=36861 RepID=UPI0030823850